MAENGRVASIAGVTSGESYDAPEQYSTTTRRICTTRCGAATYGAAPTHNTKNPITAEAVQRVQRTTVGTNNGTIGDATQFTNGRQMAASLGLTPKQNSSGGKDRLLGISKRGDAYLRSLLVHGARAVIRTAQSKSDRLSTWVMRIATTRHPNIAAVALANKTARIAWAMISRGTDYDPSLA